MNRRSRWWAVAIAACGTLSAPLHAEDDDSLSTGCPSISSSRSVEQVLASHLAALRSGDAARVACDYAKEAVLIVPGEAPVVGRGAIQAAHARLFSVMAGSIQLAGPDGTGLPVVTNNRGMALVNYTLDSTTTVVPFGVDSFLVLQGRIVGQTAVLGGMRAKR